MKTLARWSAALLVLAAIAPSAAARTGGPDGFGYTWKDSAEPGVSFNWEDISGVGADIMVAGDDEPYGFQPLSFAFPYYGPTYSQVAVTSNGWASVVDGVNDQWGNTALPNAADPVGIIAAFWNDLEGVAGTSRVLFADRGTFAVITWENQADHADTSRLNTFQLILYDDGRIKAQYLSIGGSTTSNTAGIESPDQADGLTAWYDDPAGFPTSNYAIEYYPPAPIAWDLDCSSAQDVLCGQTVAGDLAAGQARQAAYRCSLDDYSGREQVWRIDLRAPTDLEFLFNELGGDPDMILLSGCTPYACRVLDAGTMTATGLTGTVYVVVDSGPGEEGRYELTVNCLSDSLAMCGEVVEMEPTWSAGDGVWWVPGWLYPGDTHDFALRVDDATIYTTSDWNAGTLAGCEDFLSASYGVRMPDGPAFVDWVAPEGVVHVELDETTLGTCCGLMVTVTVTNTDAVPHSYDFRAFHDTAFGTEQPGGVCGNNANDNVDGGAIEVYGTRYETEIDLMAIGATSCEGQVQMFSQDFPTEMRASYQMLPPHLPSGMEHVYWPEGGEPCVTWKGIADDMDDLSGCDSDNALLLIWRFPESGTLAPGASDTARYRIGRNCAWPCGVACESPVMTPVSVVDAGPCQGGIVVSWSAATFPGAGNGVYHVYRSAISAADALTLPGPALTPPSGVAGLSFIDGTTLAGGTYYYAVVAESLDYPGCGAGPAVLGSTDVEASGVVRDTADVDPPTGVVGSALRATAHTDSTVDFNWLGAPMPAFGERYVVLRSDDDPRGPFLNIAQPTLQTWTDPAAPPTYVPSHVWYYDVRLADACDNISAD